MVLAWITLLFRADTSSVAAGKFPQVALHLAEDSKEPLRKREYGIPVSTGDISMIGFKGQERWSWSTNPVGIGARYRH